MGLPNATAILTTLPGGLRAVVARSDDGVVASYAVRTAARETGTLSLTGLDPRALQNVWTLAADFVQPIRVGDVLSIASYPTGAAVTAFVVDVLLTAGALVSRATCALCADTVTIDGKDCACMLAALSQDITTEFGGFLPDESQGFYLPLSACPDPEAGIATGTPIQISGEDFSVFKVSRSAKYNVLCVTATRKGAPRNG